MSTAAHRRTTARLAAVSVLAMVTVAVVGCSDAVTGSARVDPSDVGAYRAAESSSAAASAEKERTDADYAVCSTSTTAAGQMLSAYNVFVTALNATQNYGALQGKDLVAVAALDRGVAEIRRALSPATSDAVRAAATTLADRSGALAGVVRAKGRGELNAASGGFLQARDGLLGTCRPFSAGAAAGSSGSATPTPSGAAPR
ncbi:hypothetical protein [uncultured Williamsia sp.]|uniref:hypothetical protein n=1 Tax=uncultured Williamsia sp. TaxID=259311 RepID=UPI0026339842|nr:hypothetical protein [uncultured Williamsia sp.]